MLIQHTHTEPLPVYSLQDITINPSYCCSQFSPGISCAQQNTIALRTCRLFTHCCNNSQKTVCFVKYACYQNAPFWRVNIVNTILPFIPLPIRLRSIISYLQQLHTNIYANQPLFQKHFIRSTVQSFVDRVEDLGYITYTGVDSCMLCSELKYYIFHTGTLLGAHRCWKIIRYYYPIISSEQSLGQPPKVQC